MKYIAVFLITNLLLLSSPLGAAYATPHLETGCCKENKHKDHCHDQKRTENRDCAQNTCNVMLSCGTCGFLIIPSITISPAFLYFDNVVVYPFVIGELADYHSDSWYPPEV